MSEREQGQYKAGTEVKGIKKERSVDKANTEIINDIVEKVEEITNDSREGQD